MPFLRTMLTTRPNNASSTLFHLFTYLGLVPNLYGHDPAVFRRVQNEVRTQNKRIVAVFYPARAILTRTFVRSLPTLQTDLILTSLEICDSLGKLDSYKYNRKKKLIPSSLLISVDTFALHECTSSVSLHILSTHLLQIAATWQDVPLQRAFPTMFWSPCFFLFTYVAFM